MAELADAPDLGSGISDVQVQVLLSAPSDTNPNHLPIFQIGEGFGFVLLFDKVENTHFCNGIMKRPESNPGGPRKKKTE